MYIVLLGAPGAGKGTQAAELAKKLEAMHISTGDIFRRVAKEGTELGLTIKSYMDKGLLVPDEITVRMLLSEVQRAGESKGVIFDGFPRNLAQAKTLDEALTREGKRVDKAVYIKVSTEELIKRLSRRWICRLCQAPYHMVTSPPKAPGICDRCGGGLYQREDDRPETVKKRLEVYFAETASLTQYYEQQGKLAEINGEGTPSEVGQRILDALGAGVKRG